MDIIHVDNDQKAIDIHEEIFIFGHTESSYKFIQTSGTGNEEEEEEDG
jgi:hypothetical protein